MFSNIYLETGIVFLTKAFLSQKFAMNMSELKAFDMPKNGSYTFSSIIKNG